MQKGKPATFKRTNVKNRQRQTAISAVVIAVVALVMTMLPFQSWSALEGAYAVTVLSLFVFIAAIVVAVMFGSRSRKMRRLISGDTLLYSWVLDEEAKRVYVNRLFRQEKSRNKMLFFVVAICMTLVFGLFIIFMKEYRSTMFFFYAGITAFVALFAFGMPYYYRCRNRKGDGYVLIGSRYAYVNGFFHNWDFPLSGLVKAEVMHRPFYGLKLQYYYYDRTLRHEEVLEIPANEAIDLKTIVEQILSKRYDNNIHHHRRRRPSAADSLMGD